MNSKGTVRGSTIKNLNKAKLSEDILNAGFSIASMSIAIGYDKTYLNRILSGSPSSQKVGAGLSKKALASLCLILHTKEEDYLIAEPTKPEIPVESATPKPVADSVNSNISIGEFNALLQVLSSINDNLTKIANAQNAYTIIEGQVYGDVHSICDALGVKSAGEDKRHVPNKPYTVMPTSGQKYTVSNPSNPKEQ